MRIIPALGSLIPLRDNLGPFKLPNSERTLSTIEPPPLPKETVRNQAALEVVSGSLDIEPKASSEPATRLRRILSAWPWAWLALAAVATLGWAIALCWGALTLVQWLVG
jgi:hypothetical protein